MSYLPDDGFGNVDESPEADARMRDAWNERREGLLAEWLADAFAESTNNEPASFSPAKSRGDISGIDDTYAGILGESTRRSLIALSEIADLARIIRHGFPKVLKEYKLARQETAGWRTPDSATPAFLGLELHPYEDWREVNLLSQRAGEYREKVRRLAFLVDENLPEFDGRLKVVDTVAHERLETASDDVLGELENELKRIEAVALRAAATRVSETERQRDAIGDVGFFGGRGDRAEQTPGDLSPPGTETPSADATPKGATEQQTSKLDDSASFDGRDYVMASDVIRAHTPPGVVLDYKTTVAFP